MKQSQLFTKALKESPKDEVSINAALLIRGGFIDKLMSGVYTFLPLGKKVVVKIEKIIREEMDKLGGQEILMPALHPKTPWETTGRWETLDVLYKLKDHSGYEYALGATHEEIVSPLVKKFLKSYKDLPFSTYQIQKKFRMELRAKSGILRGKEFTMKDMYSFHLEKEDLDSFYNKVADAYKTIFDKVGIGEATHLTYASGGTFSDYSHEFQTLTPAGEDTVYLCKNCGMGVNEEIMSKNMTCPECSSTDFNKHTAIEVGNIFKLNTKYSEPFDLKVTDKSGEQKDVLMGCYGIGIERLMGTIVELNNDEKGIIWPKGLSPFDAHIIDLFKDDNNAEEIYNSLTSQGFDILFDDREKSAGEKFADSDLIGIPTKIIISPKTMEKGGVEVQDRRSGESKIISVEEIKGYLS